MADAPPLEAGAVVTVPEVAVKWWQDYVTIASVIATPGHRLHRPLLHLRRRPDHTNSMYESYWELQRTALRQLAESEILLPVARARGGAGPAGLHRAPPQGLRHAHRRVRLRQDHAVARPHPAAGGRALRDRPPDQPELDRRRLPARDALPARPWRRRRRASPSCCTSSTTSSIRNFREGRDTRRHRGRGAARSRTTACSRSCGC